MSWCERLSDRMPEVARGAAVWSAEERRHLDGCAECAGEWRLIEAACRLDSRPAIDPGRVAAAVRKRLAADRAGPPVVAIRRRVPRWILGLAAAAAIVLAVRLTVLRPAAPIVAGPGVPVTIGLDELDGLDAAELETVLADFGGNDGGADERLGDLSPDELQRVLQDWES